MSNFTGPTIVMHCKRPNTIVIDTTYCLILFPHLTMQVKSAARKLGAEPQHSFCDDNLTIPPKTTKTNTAFGDHPSEWKTLCTVTQLDRFTETAGLQTSHSLSTIIDEIKAVKVINTTESFCTIKKNTPIAGISVVTLQQSKFIKPVDLVTLNISPDGTPDLTTNQNELLQTFKQEKQSSTFCFLTPQNWRKTENHTQIQTPILEDLH